MSTHALFRITWRDKYRQSMYFDDIDKAQQKFDELKDRGYKPSVKVVHRTTYPPGSEDRDK